MGVWCVLINKVKYGKLKTPLRWMVTLKQFGRILLFIIAVMVCCVWSVPLLSQQNCWLILYWYFKEKTHHLLINWLGLRWLNQSCKFHLLRHDPHSSLDNVSQLVSGLCSSQWNAYKLHMCDNSEIFFWRIQLCLIYNSPSAPNRWNRWSEINWIIWKNWWKSVN